ncbi:MAG: GHKL domain-containing protein [Oscillospiraceae bacterium]|nr:GHKL domain-containing protein [Oscillospiraceae bacterium]
MNLWYINEFHVQLLALELLLCRNLPRRRGFWLRLIPLATLFVTLPALFPGMFFSPIFRVGQWFTFSFLMVLAVSALLLWICFDVTAKQLVFCCCVAHTLQHMIHCLSRFIWLLFRMDELFSQVTELVIMLAVLVIVYFYLKKGRLFGVENADIKSTQLIVFAIVSSFTVYFFSIWSVSNEGDNMGEQFFDFLSCLLLLIILLDLFRFRRAEEEQNILKRLLRQEQEQHEMSRANIEVINRKCHDLKHQISALRNMPQKEQEKSISDLESAILLYDNLPKTGNDDLDIVLAEKSFVAEKSGVRLQCIIDGGALSFMGTEDICSLFGNAVDNAIEAAAGEPEPDERIVSIQTVVRGNMLTVHVDNPCAKEPVFSEGVPVTSKADRDYHGFGMRSIRYVTEKYGGTMTANWEDGIFYLDILFLLS